MAVVFHGIFVDRIEGIRARLPADPDLAVGRRRTAPCPSWAVPYEDGRPRRPRTCPDPTGRLIGVRAPWGRSPDDIYMLYTGGTTGMPKGVMWRQDDLFARLNGSGFRRYPEDGGLDDVRRRAASGADRGIDPACRPARSCTAPVGSPPSSA